MDTKPNFMPGLEPLASGLASKCARFNRHQRQLSLISCNSMKSFGVKKTGKSWTKTKMGERKDIRFEKNQRKSTSIVINGNSSDSDSGNIINNNNSNNCNGNNSNNNNSNNCNGSQRESSDHRG